MKTTALYRYLLGLLAVASLPLLSISAVADEPSKAIAVLHPTKGNNVEGVVTFTKMGDEMKVVADITGLTPGKHGFHIHEFGNCSSPDGMSAGGHFNPTKMMHGRPEDDNRHVGDLGNLEADESGK